MRKRFKDANISLEQIVDGTTNCQIWFFIDVSERRCFMSEEEQSDGSVIFKISAIEDWATIPRDFYPLGEREITGANACVFGSFIVGDKPYTLLESIGVQEVIEQGFFSRFEGKEGSLFLESTYEVAQLIQNHGWKATLQMEANWRWKEQKSLGVKPVLTRIAEQVHQLALKHQIRGNNGTIPTAGYIRSHVISRKAWTPPL